MNYCPICKTESEFGFFGNPPRLKALCPVCGALERHRLLWLYIQEHKLLEKQEIKVLHIAPEKMIMDRFKSYKNVTYISVDLYSKLADMKMDLTDLQFKDESFDMVICNHVFEHIPDDGKAMSEVYRVLKSDGTAFLQVPIRKNMSTTWDDPKINTPELRLKYYGQKDHLRYYGNDYKSKLTQVGFKMIVLDYQEILDQYDFDRYGLLKKEDLYVGTK